MSCATLAIAFVSLVPRAAHAQLPPPSDGDTPGPIERTAVPITAANPIPKRTATIAPSYPKDAPDHSVTGTVTLRITIDTLGHVAEARQAFRPDPSMLPNSDGTVRPAPALAPPFVKAALDAVRRWEYEPPRQGPISFYVRLQFSPDRPSLVIWHDARPPVTQRVATSTAPGPVATTGFPSGPDLPASGVTPPRKIKDVSPVYPPEAMAARVQGIVIIEAVIGSAGTVTDARVLRSIPQLDQAALDAVRQWEFTPTLVNGQPTAIVMSVTVTFQLPRAAPPPDAAVPASPSR
jgi:protein TonB